MAPATEQQSGLRGVGRPLAGPARERAHLVTEAPGLWRVFANGTHMASTPASPGTGQTERCADCDGETRHEVGIEIREESDDPAGAAFSREPYRVATCTRCGTERAQRMNDV